MDAMSTESHVPLIGQRPAYQIRRKMVNKPPQPYQNPASSTSIHPFALDANESYALQDFSKSPYIRVDDPQNIPPQPPVLKVGLEGSGIQSSRPWRPGFWIRFPTWGILALSLSFFCTVAALIVLLYSNGKLVSAWSGNLQPSVILAYTSTLANVSLGAALCEGIVISFWNLAIRGASIPELHYHWTGGYTFLGALKALRHFEAKIVTAACIFTTIATILRGPLMQRATSVQSRSFSSNGTVQVHLAPTISDDFGGEVSGRSHSDIFFSPSFATVAQKFQNREDIQMNSTICTNCTLTVQGFGFGVTCSQTNQQYNLTESLPPSPAIDGYTVFETDVVLIPTSDLFGHLAINVTTKDSPDCEGNLRIQTCTLKAGTVSYNIQMRGSTVSFTSSSWRDDTFLSETNLTVPNYGGNTLGPLQNFGTSLYASQAHMSWGGGVGYIFGNVGLLSNIYMNNTQYCSTTFRDPMDDIINGYRELAVRMAIQAAADNLSVSDPVPYTSRITQVVYVVDFQNLGVALVVSMLGIIAVIPLFRSWWNLGREMSINPLELANAFGAGVGIFSATNGNARSEDIVRDFKSSSNDDGSLRLKYGVLADVGRLALGDERNVRNPYLGERL